MKRRAMMFTVAGAIAAALSTLATADTGAIVVRNGRFAIASDRPHMKVSWRVTAYREPAAFQARPRSATRITPPGPKGER
jgi:hypothetical protein